MNYSFKAINSELFTLSTGFSIDLLDFWDTPRLDEGHIICSLFLLLFLSLSLFGTAWDGQIIDWSSFVFESLFDDILSLPLYSSLLKCWLFNLWNRLSQSSPWLLFSWSIWFWLRGESSPFSISEGQKTYRFWLYFTSASLWSISSSIFSDCLISSSVSKFHSGFYFFVCFFVFDFDDFAPPLFFG